MRGFEAPLARLKLTRSSELLQVGFGMGDAWIRGPACTLDTDWASEASVPAASSSSSSSAETRMNIKTFLVNDGEWEAMQMDGSGTEVTCFTSTNVQMLTPEELQASTLASGLHLLRPSSSSSFSPQRR